MQKSKNSIHWKSREQTIQNSDICRTSQAKVDKGLNNSLNQDKIPWLPCCMINRPGRSNLVVIIDRQLIRKTLSTPKQKVPYSKIVPMCCGLLYNCKAKKKSFREHRAWGSEKLILFTGDQKALGKCNSLDIVKKSPFSIFAAGTTRLSGKFHFSLWHNDFLRPIAKVPILDFSMLLRI